MTFPLDTPQDVLPVYQPHYLPMLLPMYQHQCHTPQTNTPPATNHSQHSSSGVSYDSSTAITELQNTIKEL